MVLNDGVSKKGSGGGVSENFEAWNFESLKFWNRKVKQIIVQEDFISLFFAPCWSQKYRDLAKALIFWGPSDGWDVLYLTKRWVKYIVYIGEFPWCISRLIDYLDCLTMQTLHLQVKSPNPSKTDSSFQAWYAIPNPICRLLTRKGMIIFFDIYSRFTYCFAFFRLIEHWNATMWIDFSAPISWFFNPSTEHPPHKRSRNLWGHEMPASIDGLWLGAWVAFAWIVPWK